MFPLQNQVTIMAYMQFLVFIVHGTADEVWWYSNLLRTTLGL